MVIPFITMSLQGAWKAVWILISQVQKPADLDLQCLLFSKQVYPGAPRQRFIAQGYVMIVECALLSKNSDSQCYAVLDVFLAKIPRRDILGPK